MCKFKEQQRIRAYIGALHFNGHVKFNYSDGSLLMHTDAGEKIVVHEKQCRALIDKKGQNKDRQEKLDLIIKILQENKL